MNKWGSLILTIISIFGLNSAGAEQMVSNSGKSARLSYSSEIPDFVPKWRPDRTRMVLADLTPMFTDHVPAKAPPGHLDYCKRFPKDCRPHKVPAVVVLTDEVLEMIIQVNRSVNLGYGESSDWKIYGQEEYWTYPKKRADCEDLALEKRRRLWLAGISTSALLIGTVWDYRRNSQLPDHAVLIVRTDKGDLVLDNIERDPLPWQYSPHLFATRQSPFHAGKWEEINDIREEELFASVESDQ